MTDKALRVLELQAEFATHVEDHAIEAEFPGGPRTTRTREAIASEYEAALRDLLA